MSLQYADDVMIKAIANKKKIQALSYQTVAEACGVPHMTLYNYTKQSKLYMLL